MIAASKRSGWNVIESTSTQFSPTHKNRGGTLWGTYRPEIDPPASGMFLDVAPLAPPANAAFSEQELDARIERYAAKYADAPRCGCVCWCCGLKTTRTAGFHLIGWACRYIKIGDTVRVAEVYCGECFAEWGWPTEEDALP